MAVNADAAGIGEVWMGEMATFDAFALAGAAARETRRTRLVIGPLAIGLRGPVALALGAASVGHLGGRPADIALGASTPVVVEGWHGRDWKRSAERMRETVGALRPLLEGSRSEFSGNLVRTRGFRLRSPLAGTRIAVAAFGPRMLEVAGEVADRLVLNLVTPALAGRLARQAGLPTTAWVPAALDPGPAALEQLRREMVVYAGQPGYGEMFGEAGFPEVVAFARSGAGPREVLAMIPDAMIAAVGAIGDAATIRARVAEFHAAGVETVALVPVTAGDAGGKRLLGEVGKWREMQ